jgi:filamentous hemagglutinin family protein
MAHRAHLRAFRLWLGFVFAFVSATAWAVPTGSVTLDGSYGTSGALTGPNYQITAGMGMLKGNNLFQSFGTFNLVNGESATFSGPANVQNILARVTGGSPSSIDGTINSSIAGANLFFLNPAGVMFGANVQVNVTGSFVVGTANYAKLSDGNIFYADVNHPIADQGLTSAPVSAFGFLTPTPQPVSFVNSQIGSQPTSPLTGIQVIGGDITLDGAALLTPGGNLSFFSAASSGEVPFSLTPSSTQYSTAATTVTKFGSIGLTHGARAEIDGVGGGAVVIRGGKITIDNSDITSGNTGNVIGGDISVQADQLTLTSGGFIGTESFQSSGARSGSITVNVTGDLDIDGTVPGMTGNTSQISANSSSSGDSGSVTANVGGVIDLNDGDIFSNTDSSGHGGTVTVNAGSMSMEGNAQLSSHTIGAGDAGTINLTLRGSLTMMDTAGIVADTLNSGNGGNVHVSASQINMTGQTLISANTLLFSGKGGNVTVQTSSLSIQGKGDEPFGSLGITAQTEAASSGNGGVIDVTASTLSLNGGAVISSASTGLSTGNGGSVSVTTNQGQLAGRSSITASSEETNAGSIQITAADSFTLSDGSSVSSSAGENGGDVTLKVGRLLYLTNSNIQAFAGVISFLGQQTGLTGGNILIDPEFVILNNSFISANDLSPGGKDGNITNFANFFFTSDSLLHATGTIETTAPDLDLGGTLVVLPGNLVDVQSKLRESCARSVNKEFSTLIVVGRGGTEAAPEELQPDFGLRLSLPKSGAAASATR